MRAGLRSRPWVGLDVGSFSVKVLALLGGVGGTKHWEGEVLLPPASPNSDAPPSAETVGRAIARCMSEAGLSLRGVRGVSMGISGPDVIVKQIHLPLLDDTEVAPALRFEARKHLPFDPQSMILDYQIVARSATERKMDILLAAVAADHVERHLAPMRLLAIEPDILDAAPLALVNAITYGAETAQGAHVLLDIGHSASHLAIYQRGQPFFTRRLDFGGRHITRAISEGTQIPFEEAEEWKLAAGSDQPGFRVDWDSRELAAVVEGLRRDLVEELRRSLAFYRTQGQLPDPVRLQISGGSARLPGLTTQLGELMGCPVTLFNPLHDGQDGRGGRQVGPQFAQAFGLATRTA